MSKFIDEVINLFEDDSNLFEDDSNLFAFCFMSKVIGGVVNHGKTIGFY
jgi:hypothetical protein